MALVATGASGAGPASAAGREARAAAPAPVAVLVERLGPARLRALAREGAVGLLSPGAGATVTRSWTLAGLLRGTTPSASATAAPGGAALIRLAARPAAGRGAVTVYVSLPPPGTHPNRRLYRVAIVGGGYHGILRTPSTRIDGLVSVADVAPTAIALAHGRAPGITSTPAPGDPVQRLDRLAAHLAAAKDAAYGASLAITGATLLLAGLAWLVRSPAIGRASLLVAPAGIVASLSLTLAGVSSPSGILAGIAAAAPLGGLGLGAALRTRRTLALGLLAVLVLVLVVLAAEPWVVGLSALGPEPGTGGRFYGIGNGMETLLLPTALVPAALLGVRLLPLVAALALGAIGLSRTGADGGGVLVLLAAYGVLALRLQGRRLRPAAVAAVAVGAVVLAAAFAGIDALAGGHSHVTQAAGGGPWRVVTDIGRRLDVSVHKAVAGPGVIIASAWALVGLGYAGILRRRTPLRDAFLCAVAVSLLVNDTPVQVLAFAVMQVAALLAWETVTRACRAEA